MCVYSPSQEVENNPKYQPGTSPGSSRPLVSQFGYHELRLKLLCVLLDLLLGKSELLFDFTWHLGLAFISQQSASHLKQTPLFTNAEVTETETYDVPYIHEAFTFSDIFTKH